MSRVYVACGCRMVVGHMLFARGAFFPVVRVRSFGCRLCFGRPWHVVVPILCCCIAWCVVGCGCGTACKFVLPCVGMVEMSVCFVAVCVFFLLHGSRAISVQTALRDLFFVLPRFASAVQDILFAKLPFEIGIKHNFLGSLF